MYKKYEFYQITARMMKVYLFGWSDAKISEVDKQMKLFENIINKVQPKQVLHIPFARSPETETALWWPDWFIKHINLQGMEYLNATNPDDIAKAKKPLIIITGGGQTANLLEKIQWSPKLLELINNAKHVIGESSGSMILAEYARVKNKTWTNLIKTLGLIKNTIVEPHYTQRANQQLLTEEIQKTGMKYGIGIDEITGIEVDIDTFPHSYKKIGKGNIEIKENNK